MSGRALAYWTVSIETAALLAPYMTAGWWNWRRSGLVTAQNEPSALETLTTTGLSDFSSSGSAAWGDADDADHVGVKEFQCLRSVNLCDGADPGVVDEDVEVAFAFGDDRKSGSHRRDVGHVQLHELAPKLGCCAVPRSLLRAPI